jgi:mRNA interferase MazF
MRRGDIHLAAFQTVDGSPAKDRPVLVVQADFYNQRIANVLVAGITSNLRQRNDPAHVLIDVATPEGQASGLRADSLVSCLNVGAVMQSKMKRKIGELSDDLMRQVDEALKAAMSIR